MERVLFNRDQMWELLKDEKGNLILDVAVGTVGIYSKKVTLTPEQVAEYERLGPSTLSRLAQQIWDDEYVSNHGGPIRWWQFWRRL